MLLKAFPNGAPVRHVLTRRIGVAVTVAVTVGAVLVPHVAATADPKPGSSGRSGASVTTSASTSASKSASNSSAKASTAGSSAKRSSTKRSTSSAKASGLGSGAKGPAVAEVQTLLQAANYDIRDTNGSFGDQTYHAVMAFQKANGLARTGRVRASVITPRMCAAS